MNEYIKEYKYSCQIELDGDFNKALKTYLSKEHLLNWHDDLIEIEELDNQFEFNMIYLVNNQNMKMNVKILEFNPPHYAKTIYEFPGVWNLCIDKFEEVDGKILWTMDVEFKFELDQHLLIDAFIRRTYAGMNLFKFYFENLIK